MTAIDRLKNKLAEENLGGAIICSDVNRRYFTGMKSSAGTLLVFPEAAYLIIDFRYIEKARNTVKNCEVILQKPSKGIYGQIQELCDKYGVTQLAVEADRMTLAEADKLAEELDVTLEMSDKLTDIVTSIRLVKTPDELEKMIAAQRIAEEGLKHMYEFIREGVTEREIQLELDYYMLSHGAEALSFDTIALSGVNTSMPHGVPSDKKVQKGEFVLLDFGAVVDGYHSDMTRTMCVGEPTDEMRRVYNIVLEAQLKGIAAVKAGMKGCELDAVARDYIKSQGYGEEFGHSLGHGVGVEIHENPYAASSSDEVLPENSVVTVEPGIYLAGKFGVRIEDFVIVKKDGCVNMTEADKSLIVL
ncbi:Xaa-Pro aminopeptidase [Ruminococcus sp. YE71]|uniref:M24 family metallopeptidase n=1 Tax=unclassified Ruminococcus TaxID=2608920 RepID=UPI000889D90C|nr:MULTISPECIES: aminopeptidase P family protein [unclassified Ruminococcus]SDA15967.1 Xaa-Pro aminopeptidase [Ruminococcus sp. YE78]SFW23600.1 Xaa-Pro aminopeptidase [Ruminococcus sp. YE71]